jgi:MerR family transcriptional regulator, copper efflux regulator
MQAPPLDALTINEAAETTGWSARMLRYIERIGLVAPARSQAGYRLYGAAELQRLRTLRELLERHDLGLGEVGFALRLRREPALRAAIEAWLQATPARPEHVPAADWLRFEQEKHQRLLAAARTAATTPARTAATTIPSPTRTLEAA